jgi:hypothetical protein
VLGEGGRDPRGARRADAGDLGQALGRFLDLYRTYGRESVAVMTEDPYRLARDVRGIGFRTADGAEQARLDRQQRGGAGDEVGHRQGAVAVVHRRLEAASRSR